VPAARLLLLLAIGTFSSACLADAVSEARPVRVADPAAEWFVQTGCTACHSISVYGVTNLVVNAPDLSVAVEDVQRRFGRPLDDFLRAPTGTMAMVLSSRIQLSESDRQVAIEKLEDAYARYQQARGIGRPVSSH
jgi:hypothetical protein